MQLAVESLTSEQVKSFLYAAAPGLTKVLSFCWQHAKELEQMVIELPQFAGLAPGTTWNNWVRSGIACGHIYDGLIPGGHHLGWVTGVALERQNPMPL